MDYFNSKVWVFMSAEEAKRKYPGGKILGGKWVMHNKGDAEHPKIRCHYVATEVNYENDTAFYASTPPLEAIRLLVAEFAMTKTRRGKPLALSFSDATKA